MLIPLSKQMPNSAKQKDKKKKPHQQGCSLSHYYNKLINSKILVYSFHCRSVLDILQFYARIH
ncbi:hypothetical protein EQP59_05550 [Ornithobacterium rhinotracheale]|uniref:Uncharacterized protein n=1 Tax=Ornithobacterium rhinotracheale TaxID=28251 RepID=A0A3R5XUJ6_ORNRH|nr:hypothetical protein EQP59_05550 [Ornithobacterium rhinotracheale]